MLRKIGYLMLSSFFLFFYSSSQLFAAPDPKEVQRLKEDAPIHVVGEVTTNQLVEDFSEEEHQKQLRKVELSITEVKKSPEELRDSENLDIYYTYIPSWEASEYVGPSRVDLVVGDIVEIWLEEGEHGLESVLSGNTIEHIKYVENREEYIPEPFRSAVFQYIDEIITKYVGVMIIGLLVVILGIVIKRGLKKSSAA